MGWRVKVFTSNKLGMFGMITKFNERQLRPHNLTVQIPASTSATELKAMHVGNTRPWPSAC
jgi:hypothetical protein